MQFWAPLHRPWSFSAAIEYATPTRIALDPVLKPGGCVLGRVFDGSAVPAGFAYATLCLLDDGSSTSGNADATGRFAVPVPRAGAFMFSVRLGDVGATSHGPIVLDSDRDVDIGDLVLRGSATLEGRLVHPDETPVAGVYVSATPAPGELQATTGGCPTEPLGLTKSSAQSGEDGSFRLKGMQAGRYTLTAGNAGQPAVVAATGERDVRVVTSMHRVYVRVEDETGKAARGAQCVWHYRGGSKRGSGFGMQRFMDSDKALLVSDEPGTSVVVHATLGDLGSEEVTVEVPERPWDTTVILVLRAAK